VARTKPKLFQQALETGLTGKQAHHYLSIAQRVEQADHQPAPTPNVIVLVGNGVEAIGPNPWEGVWAEPVNIEATAPPHVVQVKPPTG
jgi:hypothetical protein